MGLNYKYPLYIYNSLYKKKERFESIHDKKVGMYVCGPTVYGSPHLGHAKSYIAFDVIRRYLIHIGYNVRYVMNITDVGHLTHDEYNQESEDKLQRQARIEQLEPMEIAEKYTLAFDRAMDKLSVLPPSIKPRASGHIIEQIELIKKLLDSKLAYEIKGNVYFDVRSFSGYGKLSGRDIDKNVGGMRIQPSFQKHNEDDFSLWKKANDSHIMRWPSPWGIGFPGWHIECSAMATKYLGQPFDIHAGGIENMFPHHECEIAQSEGAFHKPLAKYWLHNNMVTLNGQKMGKSLNNAISLEDFFTGKHYLLSQAWHPMTIRFFLLQSHYRGTTDFAEKNLASAQRGLQRLYELIVKLNHLPDDYMVTIVDDVKNGLYQAMSDDFNTARAIAVLFEWLPLISKHNHLEKTSMKHAIELKKIVNSFIVEVLGITWINEFKDNRQEKEKRVLKSLIDMIIDIRQQARNEKKFDIADNIRNSLLNLGIELKDNPDKTTYNIK